MAERYVYSWGNGEAEGAAIGRELLGGKGAGLHEMAAAGIPVPPGFTITTEVCRIFLDTGKLPPLVIHQIDTALHLLEQRRQEHFGDSHRPLLVSVRSGASVSMPGMMDTILNLGLNDKTVHGLAQNSRNERFAWDSYRRFIESFSRIALGLPRVPFEHALHEMQKQQKVALDTQLRPDALQNLIVRFQELIRQHGRNPFPQDVRSQLSIAIEAVFRSWNSPRAIAYRRRFQIPDHLGTAVNIVAMVFGNKGESSGTGVGFTRDPATGEKIFYGEFLANAQGEDVVAGTRTPRPIQELERTLPHAYAQLVEIARRLEKSRKDMQDFEFTIEEGKLWLLQTRSAKRTGLAAIRIACDLVDEGICTEREALLHISPDAMNQLLHPVFDPIALAAARPLAQGLPAGPGAASGEIVIDADAATARTRDGHRVLLVRSETTPDDIQGMAVAEGVLTATGGMTSHAAVVGRQMGKPCVVGCSDVQVDAEHKLVVIDGHPFPEGYIISIDGSSGRVYGESIPTIASEVVRVVEKQIPPESSHIYQQMFRVLSWADQVRRLRVRANADIPRDAKIAMAMGAEGIGLCRTEHMFFAEERLPIVIQLILHAAEARRGTDAIAQAQIHGDVQAEKEARHRFGGAIDAYLEALAKLLPMQRADFIGLFRAMGNRPVTIRTIDPPLHEFLPKREQLIEQVATARAHGTPDIESERLLATVEELHEFNPMLGHRGCRLGITYPEITAMQARAIFEAAVQISREGITVAPEIMIPLVGTRAELAEQKKVVDQIAAQVAKETGIAIAYTVGTMIEVPRGALMAAEIAEVADFFSFGTNDLTQMTFGYSRDDAGRFLPIYLSSGILKNDPFEVLDQPGVGELMSLAVERGRKIKPRLKIGICGEHGGEPESVMFCDHIGLDYVSCSPWRIPAARMAAAHAALEARTTPA